MTDVWVFNGGGSRFPSGVFATREAAEAWILSHCLSGILTKYPVGIGVYDWALASGRFKPTKPEDSTPAFIGGFSSASQGHYENGRDAALSE